MVLAVIHRVSSCLLVCLRIKDSHLICLRHRNRGFSRCDDPVNVLAGCRCCKSTIFLSAALIGLAGAFYVSSAGTLSTSVTNDVGWTGIVVAWLAKLNTVGIVITALLITVLQFGCQAASTTYSSIDANFADLIQGIILFAVLAADFFTRFRLARRAAAPKEVSK